MDINLGELCGELGGHGMDGRLHVFARPTIQRREFITIFVPSINKSTKRIKS
jgi:hypothetical protein